MLDDECRLMLRRLTIPTMKNEIRHDINTAVRMTSIAANYVRVKSFDRRAFRLCIPRRNKIVLISFFPTGSIYDMHTQLASGTPLRSCEFHPEIRKQTIAYLALRRSELLFLQSKQYSEDQVSNLLGRIRDNRWRSSL